MLTDPMTYKVAFIKAKEPTHLKEAGENTDIHEWIQQRDVNATRERRQGNVYEYTIARQNMPVLHTLLEATFTPSELQLNGQIMELMPETGELALE